MAYRESTRGFAVFIISALAFPVLLAACNGSSPGAPGPISVTQCSGSSCTPQGAPSSTPVTVKQLCPESLDYSTTYTGGSGSGEYIKVQFDSTKMQYQMTFVESFVPTSAGQINQSRAGLTITGSYVHPNQYQVTDSTGKVSTPYALLTAEQNRCAILLENGATSDRSYSITVNPQDPPMLFVGEGIVGGGIPGASIQFNGVQLFPGYTIGAVPARTFDSYPFLGFSQTVTDFSKVAGTYNELGFRVTPEGTSFQSGAPVVTAGSNVGWQPDAIQASETFNADGSCVPDTSTYSCKSTGAPWTLRTNANGTPDNVFVSTPPSGQFYYPAVGQSITQLVGGTNSAHGIMIVGNVNGQLVPVIIRVGYASTTAGNPFASVLDDQLGISLLAPASQLTSGSLSGGYIGANSASACGVVTYGGAVQGSVVINGQYTTAYASAGACIDGSASSAPGVNYTSTLFQGSVGKLIDPFTTVDSGDFNFDYTQSKPGLVNVTAARPLMSGNTQIYKAGDTGVMVQVGPVYGLLMNGVNTPSATPTQAGIVNPYLSIGAFVQ